MTVKKRSFNPLKTVVLVVAGVLLCSGAFILGRTTAGSEPEQAMDTHDHAEQTMHEHSMFMVSAESAPSVKLTVTEDAISGWNISLATEKFSFTPQTVNQENVTGTGHAHLYVDGEKVARLYGPNFHYNGTFDGTKTFRVTLNANDHSDYATGGNVIAAEQTVTHMHAE